MNGYVDIYKQLLPKLASCDLKKQAENLGLEYKDNEIVIDFMGKNFTVDNNGVEPFDPKGNAQSPAIVIVYYVISPGVGEVSETFIARHHLSPMMVGMPYKPKTTENILKAVNGNYDRFAEIAESLNAQYRGLKKGGHMWVFSPLPKTPVAFTFIEADDELPAELLITVPDNATDFLEYECLDGLVDVIVEIIRNKAQK
ncbi:MAG: DUF3786 domain-containing protein [Bacillota bacterium]|nr:DUF3786 domain-containing protein [Bacillota bacterium]